MSHPPRLDPAVLIIPLLALMIALVCPGRVPIRASVSAPAPSQPAATAPGRSESAGDANGWTWPLPGPVTVARAFQAPEHPFGPGHRGVDLSSPPGSPVAAARSGVVGFAGWVGDRWVVTVVHGSLRTTYEPVRLLVHEGDQVARGEQIGLLEAGHSGCPTAACLHWGLLRGAEYLNPLTFFHRIRPRLLPLLG
ncbi:Peptidase family M23 [Parafrankia irregularis]|uniref:Peptidase family M23 n=1 Tax=Parafrankia irregularis TaxID=795642 RepID=A0A0S4QM88_9ACTN|nr:MULTISPECIES: M23 family metallopeptidase [Parafrankia]MBE3205434.1 peptidoglycan DD-metalloendopeptidase family protein [Parafrankia sp. CH37]CUU55670.1 Peptidase family M23 [Parafrankia irregularis]